MAYIIPAWYNNEDEWFDPTSSFSSPKKNFQFDDMINHLRLFQHEQADVTLVVLNYHTNLRYFLHNQGLSNIRFWNVFDQIQGVEGEQTQAIDYRQIAWPDGVRFHFTPFVIYARVEDKLYAQLHFAQDGNIFLIHFYNDEQLSSSWHVDDRGFVSCITHFKENKRIYRDFLNQSGECVIREHLEEGNSKVIVNEEFYHCFNQTTYPSMNEVISEHFNRYLAKDARSKQIIIANDVRHQAILEAVDSEYEIVLCVAKERSADMSMIKSYTSSFAVKAIITDTQFLKETIDQSFINEAKNIPVYSISPYDSRLQLGKSQRIKELIVYVACDELNEQQLLQLIDHLLDYYEVDPRIRILLGTWGSGILSGNKLQQLAFEYQEKLAAHKEVEELIDIEVSQTEEETYPVIEAVMLRSEFDLMQRFEFTRLIIDVSMEPDLYTQIAGISAGIPQINQVETELVSHLENGYIISDIKELFSALRYYFDGLSHWNQSLVYSVDKINRFYDGSLYLEWQQILGGGVEQGG